MQQDNIYRQLVRSWRRSQVLNVSRITHAEFQFSHISSGNVWTSQGKENDAHVWILQIPFLLSDHRVPVKTVSSSFPKYVLLIDFPNNIIIVQRDLLAEAATAVMRLNFVRRVNAGRRANPCLRTTAWNFVREKFFLQFLFFMSRVWEERDDGIHLSMVGKADLWFLLKGFFFYQRKRSLVSW